MLWAVALEAAVLSASMSIDAFAAAFAYGCDKIKIPPLSVHIINLICSCTIGLSFLSGTMLSRFMPDRLEAGISFALLFIIGFMKLSDSITKSFIRKHTRFSKEIKLSVLNFKLIMRLYAEPEAADADKSESISPKEAAVLAVSLSLDGFAAGLGAALSGVNGFAVVLFSLVTGFAALMLGGYLGGKAARKLRFNITWLAGAALICLAFTKLL